MNVLVVEDEPAQASTLREELRVLCERLREDEIEHFNHVVLLLATPHFCSARRMYYELREIVLENAPPDPFSPIPPPIEWLRKALHKLKLLRSRILRLVAYLIFKSFKMKPLFRSEVSFFEYHGTGRPPRISQVQSVDLVAVF